MRDRDEGYTIKVEPNKKKSGADDFLAGVVVCILVMALIGWLIGS